MEPTTLVLPCCICAIPLPGLVFVSYFVWRGILFLVECAQPRQLALSYFFRLYIRDGPEMDCGEI